MNSRVALYIVILAIGLGFSLPAIAQTTTPQLVKDAYPLLTSGVLSSARLAELPSGMLLRSGDVQITQKDLDTAISKAPAKMRPQLQNNLFFLLENRAADALMVAEAKAWAKRNDRAPETDNALMKAYFDDLTAKAAVTDDELKMFYYDNKSMMGGATFDQVKEEIRSYLLNEKRQKAVDEHIRTIGNRMIVEVDKAWTAKQYVLAMNNPVDKARKSGKPTLADFSGEGCQPCAWMKPILAEVKKKYAGKLNVVVVEVDKEQILGARFGAESIPLLLFYDKTGKEFFRHVGFFPKDQIIAKLAEMGVK